MTEVCGLHDIVHKNQEELSRQVSTLNTTLLLLNRTLETLERRMLAHVDEGERPGGHRDRLLRLETEHEQVKDDIKSNTTRIRALRSELWKVAFIGGVIGGVVGKFATEMIDSVIKIVVR
jgi:hypothetical protein